MACMDVCPLASELSVIHKNIICPEEGCGKVFQASSALNMHLTKHHRNTCLTKKDASVTVRYFCPEEKCVYHVNASRHFTQKKYLKQHYLKVHSEKKFNCESCSKAFATEDQLRHHFQTCGMKFTCTCGNSYSSYEALLTHSKRKQHAFDERFKTGSKRTKQDVGSETSGKRDKAILNVDATQPIYILPKLSSEVMSGMPVNVLAAVALTELSGSCSTLVLDKALQTDPIDTRRRKAGSPVKNSDKNTNRKASAQTQTGAVPRNRRPRKSAETQTIGDCILKKAMEDANILSKGRESNSRGTVNESGLPGRKRKQSMETQTTGRKSNRPTCVSLNEGLELACIDGFAPSVAVHDAATPSSPSSSFPHAKDVGLPDLWFTHKNSSSTQTSPVPVSDILQQEDTESNITFQADLSLEYFSQDGSLCSSSNLRSIFEDNSDSFDNVVNGGSHFQASSSENTASLVDSLASEGANSPGNRSCNMETQTEIDFNSIFCNQYSEEVNNSSFALSSTIETQTTDDLLDFDQLLYSNMCTQTCEDILFSDLDFADIETQTAWPSYDEDTVAQELVSTETQTAITSCGSSSTLLEESNRTWSTAPTHIETQTSVEDLKELMAVLDDQEANKQIL